MAFTNTMERNNVNQNFQSEGLRMARLQGSLYRWIDGSGAVHLFASDGRNTVTSLRDKYAEITNSTIRNKQRFYYYLRNGTVYQDFWRSA